MDRGLLSTIESRTIQGRIFHFISITFLILLAIVVIFPFLYAFTSGLKGSTEIFRSGLNLIPEQPQWNNYKDAWERFNILSLFKNSIVIVSVAVGLQMIISILAAYSLSRLKPIGGSIIMNGFLLTLMIPAIAYLVPLYVTLSDVPIIHHSFLDSYWGLWLPYSANAFNIFVLKSFFDRVPSDIIDSAKIDGASPLQTLLYIILPLSRSIVIILTILTFMGIWKDYLLPLLIITNPERQPITVRLIYLARDYGVNLQMAAAFLALLPPLLVAILLQRYLKAGLTVGGVKG